MSLAAGIVVLIEGTNIVLVPDVMVLEFVANGLGYTPTITMERASHGRRCHAHRLPDGVTL